MKAVSVSVIVSVKTVYRHWLLALKEGYENET